MPQEFQIPQSILYSKPSQKIDGDINYTSFQPVSGTSFTQDQSFKIKVSSPNEFLDVRRSYLAFDLKLTGGSTTSGNCISYLGGAAVLRRLTTRIAGVQVEDIDNYNLLCATVYKRQPDSYQNFLKQVEFYNNQTVLTASSSAYTNGRTVYHAIRNGICESDQMVPLPFIRSGVEFEVQLAPLNDLLATAAAGTTGYQLSNVRFVGCMLKPSDDYLKSFQSTLERGQTAFIPIQWIRSVRLTPGTTTDQEHNLFIGFHRSLRSALAVSRESTSIGSSSTDSFNLETNNGMKNYYFRIGSERYPRNIDLQVTNAITSGTVSPEYLIQSICSLDNTFAQFNAVDPTANTANYIYYNWASNESIGAGKPIEDGSVAFVHRYHDSPAGTEAIDFFFVLDGLIEISATSVVVNTKDF